MRSIRLFLPLVCFLLLSLTHPVQGQTVWSDWQGGVWTIGLNGSIVRFPYDFGKGPFRSSLDSTTRPVVSPGKKHIAFSKGNDLWILDVKTMRATRITHVGQPQTEKLASVLVLISFWSFDGTKLLYRVAPGETEDLEGETPALKERKADYGSYILDLASGDSRSVPVPSELRAWLPGDDILLKSGDSFNGSLVHFDLARSTIGKPICDRLDDFPQVEVSPDGKRLLVLFADVNVSSELVEMIVDTGKTTVIAKGLFAEVQWGKYSPSGNHISYQRRLPSLEKGKHGDELVVDGKGLYSSEAPFYTYWIDDDTLAFFVVDLSPAQNHYWVLFDIKTEKEKTRTSIS